MASRASISACARAASASGTVCPMSGRIFPDATSGRS
jgi:hypothetical protein